MTADMAFAEFIDRCCWLYTKRPTYRQALERERPNHKPKTTHHRRTA